MGENSPHSWQGEYRLGQYFRKWGKCDAFRWTRIIFFVTLLVCGALIGGIIGQVLSQVSLSGMIPYLTKTYEIFDFKDIYLNLAVIDVHFGIRFAPNLISIFGILLAAWVYKRF